MMRGSLWGGGRGGVSGWRGGWRAGFLRGVEAAGDVGVVDEGEELLVGAAGPVAVGFA